MARKTFIVPQDFPELTHANGKKLLKEMGQTYQYWRDRCVGAWKWWTGILGMNAESFDNMTLASAVLNHCHWDGSSAGYAPGNQSTSRNNIIDIPGGEYLLNVGATVLQGVFSGSGTSIGLNGNASTELIYDAARWMDPRAVRALIISGNWGFSDYLESCRIDNLRLNGKAPGWLTGPQQHGIALRMMGETCEIGRIYVSDCNGHGVWVNGAGPGKIEDLTSFDNNLAGLCLTNDKTGAMAGGSQGVLNIGQLSMDNNGVQLLSHGGPAVVGQYFKSETGLSNSRKKPYKASPIMELHGFIDHYWEKISDAVTGAAGPAFVVESVANRSKLRVMSYTQWSKNGIANEATDGRGVLIGDVRAKKTFSGASIDDMKLNAGMEITWKANGNASTCTIDGVAAKEGVWNGSKRIGVATSASGYSYASGTPLWDPSGGTTAPPIPPVEPPVTPPVVTPPTTAKLSRSNVTVTASTCETVNVAGVTRARITLDLPSLPTGYAKIMGDGTTSLQTKDGTGELWWAGTKVGVKLIKGKNTYDIPLPNVTITCLFQQKCPGGGALVGTYESIELY